MSRLAVAAVAMLAAHAASAGKCPVTRQDEGFYGNEFLRTGLWTGGRIDFRPGGPGFVDRDGALGIKFLFERLVSGKLQVGGRRLDGEAGPARAYIYDYGDEGIQPIYLVFPTPGCWEITAGLGDARLTFVVLVEKIGDGPAWRYEGLRPGERVTTSAGR
jgi:hypothetical protein